MQAPASCKTPATFIDFIHPQNQLGKKQRIQKWDPSPNILHRTALTYIHKTQGLEKQTWKPALGVVVKR